MSKDRKKLIRNAAECAKCGDVVESNSLHDFKNCQCGEIFVDGGLVYIRGGAISPKNFIPKYEYE